MLASVPQSRSGAVVKIVPSWSLAGRGGCRLGESSWFSCISRSTVAANHQSEAITQPRPDFAMPLTVEWRGRQVGLDGSQQTVFRHRRHRATAYRVYHRDAMDGMVERRARKTPDAADTLHAVVLGGGRRDRRAHLRDLAR